jgi:hypothetical protein
MVLAMRKWLDFVWGQQQTVQHTGCNQNGEQIMDNQRHLCWPYKNYYYTDMELYPLQVKRKVVPVPN